MEQLGENIMKNLLNELQDSKREMEEKPNHASQEKNQTPNKICIHFRAIMEETKNPELFEEKEKKLRSKNLIIHVVQESFSNNKGDAIKSD